jgi:hypothetical protein
LLWTRIPECGMDPGATVAITVAGRQRE